MIYRYTRTLASGDPSTERRVPLVRVTLEGEKGRNVTVLSLLDSGADICVFNLGYAEVLGIDLQSCEGALVTGVGGVTYDTYKTELTVQPEGLPAVPVPVIFIDSPGVDGLLGQEGFFDAHRILFDRQQDVFEIVPV